MKKLMLALGLSAVIGLTGCTSVSVLLAAADAGLVAYEAGVPQGSDQYQLADKIEGELENLSTLYNDASNAQATAKPALSSQIAAVVQAIAKDGNSFLALVAIKNPQKQEIAAGVIAAIEAFIVAVQNQFPDPSGNSVQLNSTSAQLQAAVARAKSAAKR